MVRCIETGTQRALTSDADQEGFVNTGLVSSPSMEVVGSLYLQDVVDDLEPGKIFLRSHNNDKMISITINKNAGTSIVCSIVNINKT